MPDDFTNPKPPVGVSYAYFVLICSRCGNPIRESLHGKELCGVWCVLCETCYQAERNQPCPTVSS